MKKILGLGVIGVFSSTFSFAELPTREGVMALLDKKFELESNDRKCDTLSKVGEVLMKMRRSGVPFDSVYNSVDNDALPPDMKLKEKNMIHQVYGYPQYSSEVDKNIATQNVYAKTFLECRDKGMSKEWDLK